ncbi:uncharacterized protein LOC143516517 isoform X2 [Brachyhypopomus gauderio]
MKTILEHNHPPIKVPQSQRCFTEQKMMKRVSKVRKKQGGSRPDRTTPQSSRPDRTTPQSSRPDRTSPQSSRPDRTSPQSSRPDRTSPQSSRPDRTTPQSSKPDRTSPQSSKRDRTTPQSSRPNRTTPQSSRPDRTSPQSSRPDRTITHRSKPDRTTPHRSTPDRTTPHRSRPDRTTAHRSRPDRTTAHRSRRARTTPHRSRPDRTTPHSSRLDHTLAKLKHDSDCIVEVLVDQDHILRGIFYQDTTMQNNFDLFPEVLVVTTACRLSDMHVYAQLAVDGYGHCELVSLFVASDSSKTISAMVDIFKRHNVAWERTQVVVMAEDHVERLVYASHYPKAQIFTSPSHVSITMNQDICQIEILTSRQKQKSLQLLQQIAHSSGEQNYQENVVRLHKSRIQPVIDYYNQKWHPIREHWVGLNDCFLYSQNTTRQLGQFHSNLNQYIHALGDLRGFCQNVKVLVDSLKESLRDTAVTEQHVWAGVNKRGTSSRVWRRYQNLLTPYASQLVAEQVGLSERVVFPHALTAGDTAVLDSATDAINVTATSCTCPFATFNRLPCRHVFAFRAKCGLDLFSEEGVAPRWCLKRYCSNDLQGDSGGVEDPGEEQLGDSGGVEQDSGGVEQDSGGVEQDDSGGVEQDDSGDVEQDDSGDVEQDDSGDVEQDDSGDVEQDDMGGEEQDNSGDVEQDDSGDVEQDDSGDVEQDDSGDVEQDSGGEEQDVCEPERALRAAQALVLLTCTSSSSSALHEERIAVLQQLLCLWEEDKHASVVELIQVTV